MKFWDFNNFSVAFNTIFVHLNVYIQLLKNDCLLDYNEMDINEREKNMILPSMNDSNLYFAFSERHCHAVKKVRSWEELFQSVAF